MTSHFRRSCNAACRRSKSSAPSPASGFNAPPCPSSTSASSSSAISARGVLTRAFQNRPRESCQSKARRARVTTVKNVFVSLRMILRLPYPHCSSLAFCPWWIPAALALRTTRASPSLADAFLDARRFKSLGSKGQYAYGSSFRDLPCTSPLAPFFARYVSALCRFSPRAVFAVRAVFEVRAVFDVLCVRPDRIVPSVFAVRRDTFERAPTLRESSKSSSRLRFPGNSRSSVITRRPPSPRA
mmetsp:Transcript_7179/g.29716  ORF Transcript_7179/g.29716 Transcript_7179/m.29716 type:complete len:242 (+) Transcript_7179:289-1014(+)